MSYLIFDINVKIRVTSMLSKIDEVIGK